MALQSQQVRPATIRPTAGGPRTGLSRPVLIGVGGVMVIAVVAAVVLAMRVGKPSGDAGATLKPGEGSLTGNPKPLAGGPGSAEMAKPPAPSPGPSLQPGGETKKPTEPAPTTLEMGKQTDRGLVPPPSPGPKSDPEVDPNVNPVNENPTAPGKPGAPTEATPGKPAGETGQPLPNTGGSTLPNNEAKVVSEAQRLMEQADRAQGAGNLVEARALLNRVLLDGRVPGNERQAVRLRMASINETLVFGAALAKGDSLCDVYTIAGGDNLVNIRAKQSLPIDWRLLQRINRINPSALKIGQKIKIVRMPFHVVVRKGEYRLDLYAGDPLAPGAAFSATPGPDGQDPNWTYIRSFTVGLGENDGTPEGLFTVRAGSKLVNPPWRNPRTGEKFAADDPKNPIGEYWIGLEGADEASKKFNGYGLHGTIDPDSIGKSRSMGCVRLGSEDVALMYELLVERWSTVRIVR